MQHGLNWHSQKYQWRSPICNVRQACKSHCKPDGLNKVFTSAIVIGFMWATAGWNRGKSFSWEKFLLSHEINQFVFSKRYTYLFSQESEPYNEVINSWSMIMALKNDSRVRPFSASVLKTSTNTDTNSCNSGYGTMGITKAMTSTLVY